MQDPTHDIEWRQFELKINCFDAIINSKSIDSTQQFSQLFAYIKVKLVTDPYEKCDIAPIPIT